MEMKPGKGGMGKAVAADGVESEKCSVQMIKIRSLVRMWIVKRAGTNSLGDICSDRGMSQKLPFQ